MGRLQLRAWEGDLLRWQETSAKSGYHSVSEWIRQTLNRQSVSAPPGVSVHGRSILDNGVRVITESVPDTRGLAIGVVLAGGLQHERPGEAGLAHLCQQMVFRRTAMQDAQGAARALEAVGGEAGAILSRDHTGLWISVPDENAYPALDLLGGLMLRPQFPAKAWDAERSLRLQQIAAAPEQPAKFLREWVRDAGWPGHPFGINALGYESEVSGLTREQGAALWERSLQGGNMVVVAAGGVCHEEFASQANDVFWPVPPGSAGPCVSSRRLSSTLTIQTLPIQQSHFCIGVPAPGYGQPGAIIWHVWQKVLGGGVASRLPRQLRECEGVAVDVRTVYQQYGVGGVLWVEGSTSPAQLLPTVQAVLAELYGLASNRAPVSEEELAWARTQVRADLLRQVNHLQGRVRKLAWDEMYAGRRISLAGQLKEIEELRLESIEALRGTLMDRLTSVDLGVVDPSKPDVPSAKDRAALPRFLVSFRGRCRRERRRR